MPPHSVNYRGRGIQKGTFRMHPNRTCSYCGAAFYTCPARIRDGRGKFCSRPCAVKAGAYKVAPGRAPTPPESRFWKKVHKTDGCWLWTGARSRMGYGAWTPSASGPQPWPKVHAHRFSYELAYGPIPEGTCVLHACDTPACVRPDHLWLGSRVDNNLDKLQKGRQARGERHGSRTHPEAVPRGERNGARKHPERLKRGEQRADSRLTDSQVMEIRRLYSAGGISQHALAKMIGVAQTTISRVVNRQLWTHI